MAAKKAPNKQVKKATKKVVTKAAKKVATKSLPKAKSAKKPAPKAQKKAVKIVKKGIAKKAPVKAVAKKPAPKPLKLSKNQKILEAKAGELMRLGRERGYITFDEILKYFPQIEKDVPFLDEMYERFGIAGIDVLQSGGMLGDDPSLEMIEKKNAYKRNESSYDSIQMYLREIGQYHSLLHLKSEHLQNELLMVMKKRVTSSREQTSVSLFLLQRSM